MEKINKIIPSIKKLYSLIVENPKKALICFALVGIIFLLLWLLLKYIILPILGFSFIIWLMCECPIPNFQKTQTPVFDPDICDDFMTEVLTEKHELLGIRKSIDKAEIRMFPPITQKGNIQIYQCKATQANKALLDDSSMEERRIIAQERIVEKLQAGFTGIDIVPYYYPDIPSLYIDEVTVRGNKFIFSIVWAVDEVSRDYILSRQKSKQDSVAEYSAQDEDF